MIISFRHHYVFVKTRKTASTSIQMALAERCGAFDIIIGDKDESGQDTWRNWQVRLFWKIQSLFARHRIQPLRTLRRQHATVGEITQSMGSLTHAYFKLAFVRNPFDLVVSRYFWDRSQNRHAYSDITLWLSEHYSQQGRWERDLLHRYTHINGVCQMNFVGRFESLRQDFERVCDLLSLGTLELPGMKSGFREKKHYSEFYTPETRDLVARLFAKDLHLFNYSFEEA